MATSLGETQEPGILERGQEGLIACIGLLFLLRSALEDSSLSEEEEDLLLAILVKEFMKKMASEKEQAALDSR